MAINPKSEEEQQNLNERLRSLRIDREPATVRPGRESRAEEIIAGACSVHRGCRSRLCLFLFGAKDHHQLCLKKPFPTVFLDQTLFLPQKEKITHSGNIPPQALQKPSCLFFHSPQFAVRHFALQVIPDRKSGFQIGVVEKSFCLLRRQGTIRDQGFNQAAH